MPGSGVKAFTMIEKEAGLGDPFFDSEEDEVPVDMEVVYEAMKHVPLPDIDYPEHDDPISGDATLAETLPGRVIRSQSDPVVPKGILKRKAGTTGTGQPKKRGGGSGRVSKRSKVEVRSNGIRSKTHPKQAAKVEVVVGSVTAAAAKVAAEVAPNLVTGGIVAETGPRPDFSLWTVEDDLLLKNAMEAGAAMEALAKGAMQFSRRYTVREFRERWRALLYDPEIAAEAATRMVEAEYGSNYSRPKGSMEQKSPQELARKRRANSIRTLYYKRSKKLAAEDVPPDSTNGLVGADVEGVCAPSNGSALDNLVEPAMRSLPDAPTVGTLHTSSSFPKEGTLPDFGEDRTFSQMFSLLAAGGIRAVIGAIPAGMSVGSQDQDVCGAGMDGDKEGNELPPPGGLSELMASRQDAGLLHPDEGQLTHSSPILELRREAASTQEHFAESIALDTNPAILRHDHQIVEEGAVISGVNLEGDANLQTSEISVKLFRIGANGDVGCQREGNYQPCNCEGGEAITPVPRLQEMNGDANGDFEDPSPGLCPIALGDSDVNEHVSRKRLLSENQSIAGEDGLETMVAEKRHSSGDSSDVKDEQPCATSLVSAVDHREVPNADAKVLSSSPLGKVNSCNLISEESPERLELSPCSKMDPELNNGEEMDDADLVKAIYRECLCEGYCSVDAEEDICEASAMDDQCCLDQAHDDYCPELTGESCTGDLDCHYLKDHCDRRHSKSGPCVLEPMLCTLNTEDPEVPSLEGGLLDFPPLPASPSEQGGYGAYNGSPYTDADGYTDTYVDEGVDVKAGTCDEYVNASTRQGVSSSGIEPVIVESCCATISGTAELGSPVNRSGGKSPLNLGNSDNQIRGAVLAPEDEKTRINCAGQSYVQGTSTISASASDHGVPFISPTVRNSQQQVVPQVSCEGSLQAVDNFGVNDWQPSPVLPVISDIETETSPKQYLQTVMSPTEPVRTSGDAHKLRQEQMEEELESDEELARFSDVEAMILDMDLDMADDDFSAKKESIRIYRRHGRAVVRSEQAATAAMLRTLNAHGALAILYGRHLKYYIKQTEVLMGRATSDNVVDIDLGKEGRANKVSRQQANIKLKDDGIFYLRNLGRRGLTVNNKSVETGQRAILQSNCLIEVGGMRFIFEINRKLVQEHMSKRLQPPITDSTAVH